MQRFFIETLGCKVNRVESDDAGALLVAAGWERSDLASADVVVVNTCTVTGDAEKKTRKAVRRVLRASAASRVIVTGCAVAVDPDTYEAMSNRVDIVPKAQLENYLGTVVAREGEDRGDEEPLRVGADYPTRVGLKIQDGCNHACTYCIVHVARGRATSVDADAVVNQARAYAQAGVREIVLAGINLGSYVDGGEGSRVGLSGLLERLLEATARFDGSDNVAGVRFRLSSIEPMDVDERLIGLLAGSGGRICRHLHLPLQSGSSKVLREMARPYDADRYLALVRDLRRAVPRIALTTDVIAGFPGETEEDFAATLALARACGFSKMHVFPYSRRTGTPAAARGDQVPPDVKTARALRLRQLSEELRRADATARTGTVELGLVETSSMVMTESYYELPAEAGMPVGALVEVTMP